jgi:hypothetical protein
VASTTVARGSASDGDELLTWLAVDDEVRVGARVTVAG